MADLQINPSMVSRYALVTFLCLGAVACSGSGVANSSPSPVKASSATASPVNVYPGAALGPAPSSCSRPTPKTVNPSFGLAIGESTVYAVGAWDSTGIMHVDRATQTQHGEQVKVLWVIKSGFNQPVSVRGKSMSTGRPL